MNKRITTLLASAMLATAFSAGATVDTKKGDAVLLKTGSSYLSAQTGTNFGKLVLGTTVGNLTDLNKATWTISEKKTSLGKTIYSFVNKATGLTLAVDPTLAVDQKETKGAALTLGGNATEWVEESDNLVSYFKGDSVLFIKKAADNTLFLAKGKVEDAKSDKFALNKDDFQEEMELSAADLNTLLQSVSAESFFGLNMTPEVTTGQTNLLTATPLKAEEIGNEEFVYLQAKGQKKDGKDAYVVVDTAYYGGTQSGKFLKYTYDHKEYAADKKKSEDGSYKFKFTYNAKENKLYAQVAKVVYEIEKGDKTDAQWKTFLESNNNSTWTATEANKAQLKSAEKEYIYMAKLAGVNVLTVNVAGDTRDKEDNTKEPAKGNQNVTIKIGTNFVGLKPTTIPEGVYTVQYKAKKGNDKFAQNGAYALANLAGDFGWADQAKRQDFNHMPAAQWVVKKVGTSSTALVAIDNREFSDLEDSKTLLPKTATQFYAVEGSDDVFFFNNEQKADTLSFVKVADELVKDTKLGYKYVSANEAKVQTYTFNYLHGLSLDKYLFTPAGKDSIVRVDEKDGKSNFRLTLVVEDDKYGYEDGLVRNAYYVSDGKGRYISYDKDTKKYMMKSKSTPFFLKENNCDEGKHYYALVEVEPRTLAVGDNFYFAPEYEGKEVKDGKIDGEDVKLKTTTRLYDKNGHLLVKDHSEIKKAYVYTLNTDGNKVVFKEIDVTTEREQKYDSNEYARVKVSVDDNTLDLTEGKLNDKFDDGTDNEIRTSAFAVEIDDSPLYRRFNNAALGETETADSLYFVEKTRGEYLMDEWNKNLQDKTVDYAGIWSKDKAKGKLAFIVDSVWVKRGLGNIKPQYLISVARNDQAGTPGVPCTYEHNHFDNAGNPVSAAECSHATKAHAGFHYGKYLVSFGDSAVANKLNTPYMDIDGGYTRVGFVKAIHSGDSLFILVNEFKDMDPAKLDVADIIAAYTKAKINTKYIVNLQGDNHKNVTWSFRYVTPSKEAGVTAEEGTANEFLFESNIYNENATSVRGNVYVGNDVNKGTISMEGKATKGFSEAVAGSIAPQFGAWLKMQNGCLVLTRGDSQFSAAKTGSDGALIFNAYPKAEEDDMVTSNDEVAVEGVSVIAGNGTVTVQGAAGKSVVITNILGKVIAETVLTSDNATISVPAGIVAVAVDGEEAVKAIVK